MVIFYLIFSWFKTYIKSKCKTLKFAPDTENTALVGLKIISLWWGSWQSLRNCFNCFIKPAALSNVIFSMNATSSCQLPLTALAALSKWKFFSFPYHLGLLVHIAFCCSKFHCLNVERKLAVYQNPLPNKNKSVLSSIKRFSWTC